ncbi:MAG TPA: RluA family pseudouridine synthase [Microthrixaceae bacterium]|nr:RluA family pseudouridine synthase [Microthrixaceae bacterium]
MSNSDPGPFVSETIPDVLGGERVDRIVAMITGSSRAEAADVLANGLVSINGKVVTKASTRLLEGDDLAVQSNPVKTEEALKADPDVIFEVVHEDEQIIVIDKPAGLVVHPGAGHSGSTLVHGLIYRFPELTGVGEEHRPGLVHRLDRGTSGLLVVARTPHAYSSLVEQISRHEAERIYSALTWGHFEHAKAVIDAPIGRSKRDPLKMTVAVDGRESRTHYSVDQTFWEPIEASLITCQLETGRTHQIRVHLSSVGHSVIGDPIYGGARKSFPVPRPFLHARWLSFMHPGSGEKVSFESSMPADLKKVLAQLS